MTAPSPSDPQATSTPSSSGGHALAPRFHGGHAVVGTDPRAPRPRRTGLILGILGGAAVLATLGITQLTASLGYDAAAENYDDATATVTREKSDLRTESSDLQAVSEAALLIVDHPADVLVVDAAAEDALRAAVAAADEATTSADALVASELPPAGEKPALFWDLFGSTAQLDGRSADAAGLAADLDTTSAEVGEASTALVESGIALLSTAGEAAVPFEAAHISARNDAVIALRDAAADVLTISTIDDAAATTYIALQDAAAQVIATENEELAEKAGPLLGARLEIEAFARALAPGVLLEFDWAPVVNGAGYNGSMGGYTTWWWDDPGRSVIQLSNSVAEQWPADRSQALVAHEVGHAISVKCQDMYDSSTQDSIEKWATAWAISMGFTDDANGVWAYGYPPQSYIDAAAGCR
ncbi:hypothetical protein AB3M89_14385 [Microbacterium sp. 179-I 3D2 NHS]|uniref:hypothetical protein n=1 Tax=Microbacterium sp. 179-I 3D2 NHS TaxID=3235178 RepID=UPI0039A01E1A